MNREKILKSSTIIPDQLYVERSADRQIRRILDEMGRPGYILVARQLGKTNLLLHTKTELEDDNFIFIYVDLSNIFETERECFRNIIDTAVDTHATIFDGIRFEIEKLRQGNSIPPQKEHERELRLLLNKTFGKMAVFLDEIDALSNTAYSDKIFAQIRSIYFSRVNYSEYGRLTYILSGVLEPSEIINNKNISPFNIGEKIYLDDFTEREFQNFITKTNLQFDKNIIDRIYYWASGNPRITWDICSELEKKLIKNEILTSESVDSDIRKLYLKDYDAAPIDHIRDLVENNKDIRNAVSVIKFGKGETLDDEIKRKLYLAGIIKSDFDSDDINIKNEVINQSLSDKWLSSLEKKDKSLLDLANDKFVEEKYEESILLYKEYLEDNQVDNKSGPICYFQLGYSYYKIQKYEDAIAAFKTCLFDKKGYASSYFRELYLLGMCQFYVGDFVSSIKSFEEITTDDKHGENYFESLLNLAGAYTKIDFIKYKEKIIQINNFILENLDAADSQVDENKIQQLKTTSFYNLGKAYEKIEDSSNAIENYKKASTFCDLYSKPRVLFELYNLEVDSKSQILILSEIIQIITDNNLIPEEFSVESPLNFDSNLLYHILAKSFSQENKKLFLSIFEFTSSNIYKDIKSYELYLRIGYFLIYSHRVDEAKEVIVYLLNRYEDDIEDKKFLNSCYKASAIYFNINKYTKKYFSIFDSEYPEDFDILDLHIFTNEIPKLIDSEKYSIALNLISIANHYRDSFDEEQQINYSIIIYFEFIIYQNTNDIEKALSKARYLVDFIDKNISSLKKDALLGKKEIESIRQTTQNYLYRNMNKTPKRLKNRKIGRNEYVNVKYNDGRTVEIKYKKVVDDINKGLCEIIE